MPMNPSNFTNQFQETYLDTNDDGLFEGVTISIGANITEENHYRLSCKMVTQDDSIVAYGFNSTFLQPGMGVINITVDGMDIYKNKISGPLELLDLILENSTGFVLALISLIIVSLLGKSNFLSKNDSIEFMQRKVVSK